ncbi:hypothetical protein ITJ44_12715 [Clavibacter sp. VKM Ac-2873]|uniref:hypothetical protein n=1 Tax=Clavibacter sp. VKM Ac-2873 TaxID=2783813 RepID=UPI00188A2300|nr:hypothetical protein [Clavibacter sp. VKM Ac-2873]MBF4618934.1 hypothetical protein [Clavibacter sp. VKM Ac-2873]
MTPEDMRRRRIRAARDAAILSAVYLVSQLVIVPVASGRPATEQAAPAAVWAVLLFAFAYSIRVARHRRSRDGD